VRIAELRDVLPFSHGDADERAVVCAHRFDLLRVLCGSLDAVDGPAVVEERLGSLIKWDSNTASAR
jgi:hypothetical protein